MFEELEILFESPTIKPSFETVHVILALFIFENNKDGIGRYRLQKELLIGSGTARSLIKKLNQVTKFIRVLTDENKRKGHILTKSGFEFLKKLKQKILLIEEGEPSILKDIIIKPEGNHIFFCIVREAIEKISNGIEQRDAAIKIGGVGATCLLFNGKNLIFPSLSHDHDEKGQERVDEEIFKYIYTLIKKNNYNIKENDVIIIGLGNNPEKARLAALNAALTIL